MKKIVINTCIGGFDLSKRAYKLYCDLIGKDCFFYKIVFGNEYKGIPQHYKQISVDDTSLLRLAYTEGDVNRLNTIEGKQSLHIQLSDLPRDDENLIKVVEELGKLADTEYSKLKVVEIPDDIKREILENEGKEIVSEIGRTRY